MVTPRELMQRDIVVISDGLMVGHPTDILLDPENHCVGVVIVESGKTAETCVLCPASAIASYESDTLALDSLTSLKIGYERPDLLELVRRDLRMRGRTILSTDGHMLGRIVDADIDERGNVVQYKLRKGFFGWLHRAQIVMPSEIGGAGADTAVLRGNQSPDVGH